MSNSVYFNKDNQNKILKRISRSGLDAVFFEDEYSIKFLTGFYVSPSYLIASKKGFTYLTSSMNQTLASKNLKRKNVKIVPITCSLPRMIKKHLEENNLKRIAIDPEKLSLSNYTSLKKALPECELITNIGEAPTGEVLDDLREIKSNKEVRIIRSAAKETVKIWRCIKRKVSSGMTENKIKMLIDKEILCRGFENSFETIVATGPNSAYPHAISGTRKLGKNDHLLVDFGIRINGYCSDLTRTLYTGRIDRQILEFKKIVEEVQDFAIKWVAPGKKVINLIKGVNKIFNNYKVESFVLHGLGHGVGLEIHERPQLFTGSLERFKQGMIATIEPGLYKGGLGGVRKEDMILVTKNGCEVLTV